MVIDYYSHYIILNLHIFIETYMFIASTFLKSVEFFWGVQKSICLNECYIQNKAKESDIEVKRKGYIYKKLI